MVNELEKLVREAVRLGRAGDWGERSVEVNTKILGLSPDNAPALTRRGRCHFERGNYKAAEVDYKQALSLDAGNRIAKNFLRRIEDGESPGASAKVRTTQRERERVAAKSRRKSAEYKAARAREAATAQRQKRWKQEADQMRVEELTSFAEAFGLAVAARQGPRPDYPLAITAFRRAFVLDRSRRDIIVRLAATHRANGDLGEAERLYGWVLEREDNSAARVGQAAVYRDMGRLLDACSLYKKVLVRTPKNSHALLGLAGVLSDLGHKEEAARKFEEAAGAGSRRDQQDALAGLERIRKSCLSKGEVKRAEWIGAVMGRIESG